ncbi:hypothetical protein [Nitrosopumilus sp.]|uniref:hypothetical protein n=1 Tax=Nitrosopumilus sp. TaxID=2024843 RepID=UPI003B5A223E
MSKDSEKRENIFEILDGVMFQLGRTKKMFMIMILTTLIIPPIALLVSTAILDSPFEDNFQKRIEERLQHQLDSGRITQEEYDRFKDRMVDREKPPVLLRPPQMIIFVISLVWLGIGIRQWTILSKWDKKYQKFKKQQEDIDRKLDDDDAGSDDDSD